MERTRRYKIDGEAVDIPLRWDERTQAYVEDCNSVIECPIYTPSGYPILLTIEDACPHSEMVDDDPASIDCGSCRHYHQFPSSLLGVCNNEKRRKKRRARRSGQSTKTKEEMT